MGAFFRAGLNQKAGPNCYLVPGTVVWEGCDTRKGSAGAVKAALSMGSGATQQSWCQLMLSIAKRSRKATGVTTPEEMALITRMPKWLFTFLLSGVQPSSCAQHHGVGGYSAQGWFHMLLHSSTVLEPLHLHSPLPTVSWDVRTRLTPLHSAEVNQAVLIAVGLFLMRQHLP